MRAASAPVLDLLFAATWAGWAISKGLPLWPERRETERTPTVASPRLCFVQALRFHSARTDGEASMSARSCGWRRSFVTAACCVRFLVLGVWRFDGGLFLPFGRSRPKRSRGSCSLFSLERRRFLFVSMGGCVRATESRLLAIRVASRLRTLQS